MKKTLLFIFTLCFTISEMNAQVSLPYYESFNYTVGGSLVSTTGNLGPWLSTYTTNINTDPVIVASPTWTLPTGLPAAAGNAIEFQGGSDDPVITFAAQGDTGSIYSSFVFKITDQSSVTSTSGGFIYSFGKVNSNSNGFNYASAVYIRKISATQFNIGVSETNSSAVAAFSPTAFNINTDYFIVISYDIANQTSYMWINPASVSASTEPVPTLNTSTDAATGTRNDIVVVRMSLESNANTPTTVFDEIRIGKTWASVVTNPTLGVSKNNLDSKLKIYPNPAQDFITVESNSVKISSVELYNLIGQKVKSQSVLKDNKLNVSDLSKGMYLLKVNTEDSSATRKILID
ncbi:T9SS type A sorting domain-containing protein [Mariniflexile sp. AS56]|uniref:T9SS type A sorting domain-containing protein n=1 Tax=Mariniflexile sp. AS56 TaxID=3063957 RepID=UPI0026ED8440|nr:T9SS type A sorting domain-containing protein [Mariniflexile sp. AS56]MDO7173272.1 T9SS type A sorting domain-containing protein [Mariniflexile sp. AS56]